MTIHNSLKFSGASSGKRNVWTRVERLAALQKVGQWQEGDSVEGLRKVRTSFKVKSAKKIKAEAAAADSTGEGDDAS